jgi:hypothetical protein
VSAQGTKTPAARPEFDEEPKSSTPAEAEAREKDRLDDAIRTRADASGSGSDPNRTGSAKKGAPGPSTGGSGSGTGPIFDRVAAEKRVGEVPNRQMTKKVGDKDVQIFDQDELDLLDLEIPTLKKKPAETKAALKRWKVPTLVKLQELKTSLGERARGWRRRTVELEEEAWAAGQAAAQGQSKEAKKAELLAKITGHEPWVAWNGLIVKARKADKAGPWADELAFGEFETEMLAPLTKMAAEEHADWLVSIVIEVGPTASLAMLAGALLLPKAFAAYTRYQEDKAAREEREKRRQAAAPPAVAPKPEAKSAA